MSSARAAPVRPRLRASAAAIARNLIKMDVLRPAGLRTSSPIVMTLGQWVAGGVNETASLGGCLHAHRMDRAERDREAVPGIDRRDQQRELHQFFIGELRLGLLVD